MTEWNEVRVKVISTVAAAAALALGAMAWNWAASNIVFASDIEDLAANIGAQLREEIAPLARAVEETNRLAQQNAADIKQGRIDALRAALRNLVASANELESRRDSGGMWTRSDELLLETWLEDIDDLEQQITDLGGTP